jgi:hypothetical protein
VSFQCFGERLDGGQTDDVTCGCAPEEQHQQPPASAAGVVLGC